MPFPLPNPVISDHDHADEVQQNFDALAQYLGTGSMQDSLADVGDIKMTARSTAPSGWLLCDGSAVSRTNYSALFSAIGTTYGVGDGSTTFNVPDLLGRVPMGSGTGSGLTARTLGTKLGGENTAMPNHVHNFTHPFGGLVVNGGASFQAAEPGTFAGSNPTSNPNIAIVQASTVVNFLIKV